jgi:DNA-3-methyladenine glycosylase
MKKLPSSFFEKKTLTVAKELLGKYLVRKVGNKIVRERITEVEAYVGPHDLASHSSKGRTKRTDVMFKEAGTIYVYLIYGMHYMLNIVTEEKDFPAAVLIRGTENYKTPGVVTREMRIDKSLNGKKLGTETGFWIEDSGEKVNPRKIKRSTRIGVNYAGPVWSKKLYRFNLET